MYVSLADLAGLMPHRRVLYLQKPSHSFFLMKPFTERPSSVGAEPLRCVQGPQEQQKLSSNKQPCAEIRWRIRVWTPSSPNPPLCLLIATAQRMRSA